MAQLNSNNVFADGTACLDSPVLKFDPSIPGEFDDFEGDALLDDYLCSIAPPVMMSQKLDFTNVYADGTACIDSCAAGSLDENMPSEFSMDENEASFHGYLCSIAPPVMMSQKLDFNNVYADGTAGIDSFAAGSLDENMPSEFSEGENEASFHDYLCNIAPIVVAKGDSNPKVPETSPLEKLQGA
jgi:hypothetical protein